MSKIKVLYVEDEPLLAKIVKESLESRDFQVFLVADGINAITRFKETQPDICVLDVMLPHVDGFTIGQQIRDMDSKMPILFLTAKTQPQDLLNGFASGGNDYIKKPFSMEELIVRINNLIHIVNRSSSSPEICQIGKFLYKPLTQELIFKGKTTSLSYREAQLISILYQNRNQAISRKHILKDIWGDDSFFNSRNLDVYITKLRNYLKADPSVRIMTLKGVGYQFIVSE